MGIFSLKRKKQPSVNAVSAGQLYQKVVLVNIKEAQSKLTVSEIANRIQSMKFQPAEDQVADLLAETVKLSIKNGHETADISNVFNFSYSYAYGCECFPKEAVQKVLMNELFEVVEETSDELKVKLKE